jgi:hypothetical protein
MRNVRVLIGIVLTIVGTVWLVERLGGVPQTVSFLGRWSPAVLVALGAVQALALLRRSRLLAPAVLIAIGAGGMLILQGRLSGAGGPLFWPLVVLAAGPSVALLDRDRHESDEGIPQQAAILRTRRVIRTEREFRFGKVRAVLGNLEFDLTHCQLPADAELHLTVLLGHVGLVVPAEYQVEFRSEAVAVQVPTLPQSDRSQGVVIDVSVLGFAGAVEVRRPWTQVAALPGQDEEEQDATASATALRG